VPFASPRQLILHFVKHGHKFGAASELDYEQMADAFMSEPLNGDLHECISPHGARCRNRIQASTLYFGVALHAIIRTFHPKDANGVAKRGGPAAYVAYKCSEVRR
jgi:hypothetical protein